MAGLLKYGAYGAQQIVCVLTGRGLKDPETAIAHHDGAVIQCAAQREAIEQGCDQVVFLDAQEFRYIEALGGMNLFFVHADGRVVTPADHDGGAEPAAGLADEAEEK